jgi:hypothetical protein
MVTRNTMPLPKHTTPKCKRPLKPASETKMEKSWFRKWDTRYVENINVLIITYLSRS